MMTDQVPDNAQNLSDKYTLQAIRTVEKTTQNPYFLDQDPEMMFEALLDEIRAVSFGDYLKRYIRRKESNEGRNGTEDSPDALEYLCAAFKARQVPPSFTPTTAKLRSLAKNWLIQRTVNRNVVFLLGFALEMSPDDVNELLGKALKEPRINPKDPFEVICWYCYQNRLSYSAYEEIWNRLTSEKRAGQAESLLELENTVYVRRNMESIHTESELAVYLSRLNLVHRTGRQSVAARKQFDLLYHETCEQIAMLKTGMDKDDAVKNAYRLADRVSRSDRIYDYQKNERVQRKRETYHVYTAEEINPSDVENTLYSAVPKDINGNLAPMKDSSLNIQFSGKRLNRQHITEILEGKTPIHRFDLITLCFFVTACGNYHDEDPQERYSRFISKTNQVLKEADMEPLYVANPYESFLLMCMLTEDPLGSFSDVLELSYENE